MTLGPRRLWRQSAVYALGLWSTSLASAVLTPVYTRCISADQYGVYELLSRTTDIILMFARMGMIMAVLRFFFLVEERERPTVIGTALTWSIGAGLASGLSVWAWSEPLSRRAIGAGYAPELAIMGWTVLFELTYLTAATLLRVREQVALYTVAAVSRFLLAIAANMILVVWLRRGLWGIVVANAAASGLSALAMTAYCVSQIGLKFSFGQLGRLLVFGAPLVLTGVPTMITNVGDRYLLNLFASAHEVGIYSLATKVRMALSLAVFDPFVFVYAAFIFSIAKEQDAPCIYARTTTYLAMVAIPVALAVALFSPEVVRILAPASYGAAAAVVPVALLGEFLWGIAAQFEIGIYLTGHTMWKPVAAIVASVMSLAGNFLLIPRYGPLGAAWAYVGARLPYCIVLYLCSNRLYHIPYEWRRLATVGGCGLLCYVLGSQGASLPEPLSWQLRLGALAALPLLLFALRFPVQEEMGRLRSALQSAVGYMRHLGQLDSPGPG